ncbi:hypothetical protein OIU77_016522 [Salix suchowensis]|uniref:Plastid lipid-associated protein/fibrillin conserved domain-containing protein n=1 Tax=Salix suchowensis TaxID=1278906 RepID=A0ABQ8ZKM8_9ROSI|nr:hypothetical protein OIU77_016522 [Salix suchowensis]
MATKLVNPGSQVVHSEPRMRKMLITHSSSVPPIIHPWTMRKTIADGVRPLHTTKVAEQSPGLVNDNKEIKENDKDYREVEQIKADLYQAVQVINRGIFGVPSAKQSEIHGLAELLESQNPTSDPTLNLEKVGGCWKLSNIDVAKGKAVNVINFNVRGLNLLNGQLTIEASFKTASKSRVDINYESSTITPDQLMNMFRKNYDLLLNIFNPDGWLEITYVDDNLRIGRDDSGNIFILERSQEPET